MTPAFYWKLASSSVGINITKQSLKLRNCPSGKNTCDPPIILETTKGKKVWSNDKRSTRVDIDVRTDYIVHLPKNTPYILNDTTKIGLDELTVRLESQRGEQVSF